jgi:uncharacterized protein
MAKLMNKTTNEILLPTVEVANSFLKRLIGLMGRKNLVNSALWIPDCDSIHTSFMRFSIDLAFVDKKMNVVAIKHQVKPWRLVLPITNAFGVFEMPSGTATRISVGDVLHVDANSDR